MPQMYCSLEGLLYSPYPPVCLDIPMFAARRLHVHNDARDPSSERWNCVDENWLVILPEIVTPTSIQGSFTCRKSTTLGPMALVTLQRKACWGFFRPEKSRCLWPGLNPRTWVLKGSMLPLDHRSCYRITFSFSYFLFYLHFIYSFYSWYNKCSAISSWTAVSFSRKMTQSLLCTPSHHSRMQLLLHCNASIHYLLPTISPFKSLPVQFLLPITNGSEHTLTH
jgi:hypothetical protein